MLAADACVLVYNTAMSEPLSAELQTVIHEWTTEQVQSAAKPNFGKVYVTAPNLLERLGDVTDKRVLELGCGNGYWLRLLSRAGAWCTGIDHAEQQIEAAKAWDDPATKTITYSVGDICKPLGLQAEFDIVFLEHVLLEITTKEGLEGAIKNARNALKPGGKLVVSDLHPFAPASRPANLRVSDDFSYFDSGAQIEIASKRVDGETIYYKDCHWTLSDIFSALATAGFVTKTVTEPLPRPEDVAAHPEELAYRLTHPMAIMIEAEPAQPAA